MKNSIIKYISFWCFWLHGSVLTYAISIPDKPTDVRRLPKNFKEAYSGKEYDYAEYTSFLDRFLEWIADSFRRFFRLGANNSKNTIENLEFIFYLLIAGGAIYLITKLFLNKEVRWLFGKSKNQKKYVDIDEITHVGEEDFKTLIALAEKEEDYRTAIKYNYLFSLKRLNTINKIKYDSQKTSQDYLEELEGTSLYSIFNKVAYYYTYIWYGEFDINSEEYQKASSVFLSLTKSFDNE